METLNTVVVLVLVSACVVRIVWSEFRMHESREKLAAYKDALKSAQDRASLYTDQLRAHMYICNCCNEVTPHFIPAEARYERDGNERLTGAVTFTCLACADTDWDTVASVAAASDANGLWDMDLPEPDEAAIDALLAQANRLADDRQLDSSMN